MISIKMFPQGVSSSTLGSTEATDDLWMGHMVSLNMDTEVLSWSRDMKTVWTLMLAGTQGYHLSFDNFIHLIPTFQQ